jgi:hypothetical protein
MPFHIVCFRGCLAIVAFVLMADVTHAADDLRTAFREPPDEAKPRGYWVWPHGNFDYSTMRRELAEFKAMGLGGVDIFDLGIKDTKNVIPPGPGFMSVEQVDGIAFALAEAKRLGLKMGLIVSSSWNAGATWTPPELAMMNLVAWQETVTGPVRYERILPLPELPEKFTKPYGEYPLFVPKDERGLPRFRKDIAVLAFPLESDGRLADPRQVRVLNDQVDSAGRLTCDLPEGQWVVMRTVLVNFGQRLWVPSDNSQGLTMDHFSKEATRHHFQTIIDRLTARVGPLQDTALERFYLASYEANAGVIWTPGFEKAFREQNGYRIEPFLPALYGITVVDPETTERFRYDYRKTVSELFINNLYREASRICRAHGQLLCSEAGGPGTPLHDVPTEELKSLGSVDIMRGEFWNGKTDQKTPDGFEEVQIVKSIASAAHIYGHRIIEMESFTSHINWQEGPDVFKPLADRAFCEGMTRAVYHTMSHNLPEAGLPGWTYQAGSHMNTNLTWWRMSQPLHAYLTRCSALLMQGHFVADVAYYYGDEVPHFAKPKHIRPGLAYGYDYDDLNTEILLRATVNAQGEVALPSGMRYAVLVLPADDRRMDLEVLRHVERLLQQGATVIGSKPQRTYGLRGYPNDEQQLKQIADRLWDQGTSSQPFRSQVGKGQLISGKPEREVLGELGIGPDFDVWPATARSQIDYIHRRTADEEIYFLRNAGNSSVKFEAQFRVQGKRPELWDAVGGTMLAAAAYQETETGVRLPLDMPAHGSTFVVFVVDQEHRPRIEQVKSQQATCFPQRSDGAPAVDCTYAAGTGIQFRATSSGRYEVRFSDGRTQSVDVAAEPAPLAIEGPWDVRFPFGWDVPVRQTFEALRSWTDALDLATRSFSGTAVYARQFDVDVSLLPAGQQVLLDLGEVREAARVYLNGHEVGVSLFAPHVLDVTSLVRPGTNSLSIEVANTWLNRLIADDALPESQRRTHTNLSLGPTTGRWRDAQPKPSGLLGPVRLVFPQVTTLNLQQ